MIEKLKHFFTDFLFKFLLASSEGRCMAEWGLVFCIVCRRMVEEAGFIFDRITKLKQDYEEVRKKIRARILVKEDGILATTSNMRRRGRRGKDRHGSSSSVVEKIREYFCKGENSDKLN